MSKKKNKKKQKKSSSTVIGKNFNVGNRAAEADRKFLLDCFVETDSYNEIIEPGSRSVLSGTPHPSVIVMNQKVKGDAVSITYAFLPQDGTLAIYPVDSSGKIGTTPLGKVSLKAGDHRDIKVGLNSSPKEGMRLQAVIEKSGQPLKNSGDASERTFKVL